ncbi:MAG: phosphate signaling complex protein PhoU [Deltaproteobacteria bacterium]|jgi:phosphate transport system protein|nr:phosphate signaling complex protein PhoU [Deltaproteobacteria bacterium]
MNVGIFEQNLMKLKRDLVEMGYEVVKMLRGAGEALQKMDKTQARSVIKADNGVNALENSVVHKAITLIALNQPVAGDLRFLASSLRLASEIERIGDLGSNLARRTIELVRLREEDEPDAPMPEEVPEMFEKALYMLEMAIKAFEDNDTESAQNVIDYDDNIDDYNRAIKKKVLKIINNDGHKACWGYEVITLASHLERLGDHATNLAEETFYMAKGKNIRHVASLSRP